MAYIYETICLTFVSEEVQKRKREEDKGQTKQTKELSLQQT